MTDFRMCLSYHLNGFTAKSDTLFSWCMGKRKHRFGERRKEQKKTPIVSIISRESIQMIYQDFKCNIICFPKFSRGEFFRRPAMTEGVRFLRLPPYVLQILCWVQTKYGAPYSDKLPLRLSNPYKVRLKA